MRRAEDKIREQTRTLMEAYADLTGREATPDLSEFLMIRQRAEEEIRRGLDGYYAESDSGSEVQHEMPVGTQPVPEPVIRAPKPDSMPKPQAAPQIQTQAKKPEHGNAPQPEKQAAARMTPAKKSDTRQTQEKQQKKPVQAAPPIEDEPRKPLSDFEILRQVKDEWN